MMTDLFVKKINSLFQHMSGAVMKFSGKFDEADLKEMATNRFMGN